MGDVLDLPDLPTDLFLMVTCYLDPIDIFRCRLVSKSWQREFTDDSFLRDVLVREYDKAQDVQSLLHLEAEHMNDGPSGDDLGWSRGVWRNAFDRVLARKLAIKSGMPRSVTKRDLRDGLADMVVKQEDLRGVHVPIPSWHKRRKSCLRQCVPTDLLETEWTYDSGLLVYHDKIEFQCYVLLDIGQNAMSIVPFEIKDRIVRRLRLKHGLLVFEWAEKEPYHRLNKFEEVHRHYATAFDVKVAKDSFPWLTQWKVTFRIEWKLHYFGFQLSLLDCWFSDHSTTHYAVYIWQTNRSAWGENQPIESVFIWDISQSSSHHPPGDPPSSSQVSVAPRLVKKLSYLDLDFLGIRQRDTPFLRKIALDGSACLYFFEEGSTDEMGAHVGVGDEAGRSNPRDVVWERIVGIPVLGTGPRWEDRLGRDSTFAGEWQHVDLRNLDRLTPKRATCWRYDGMGSGIRNQVVVDESARIRYSVVQRTMGFPEVWVSSDSGSWCTEIDLLDIQWQWKQIDGDERYLLIESDEELHILHFDVDLRAKKGKWRPFLRTA